MPAPQPNVCTALATGNGDDTVAIVGPDGVLAGDIPVVVFFVDAGIVSTIASMITAGVPGWAPIAATATGVRRGVCAFRREAPAYDGENVGATFTILTADSVGQVDGLIFTVSGATANVYSTGVVEVASSDTPSHADVTTDENEQTIFACVGYASTTTITDFSGALWLQAFDAQNNGTHSISIQRAEIPTAQTVSGETATLGASANWGTITFALKALYPEGTDRYAPIADVVQVG